MDMKKLLESITRLEGKESMKGAEKAPTGPKFTGYWKGSDSATPGNKMVGGGAEEYDESILKDLSKGPTPKTREQELAEEWANFMEDDLGVEPKRPGRTSDRPHREYTKHGKPSKRYTPVNEYGKETDNFTAADIKELEGIRDLATLKDRAFALISKPSKRPMKPEKVQWFKSRLDSLTTPIAVIKLMYDLLLSGEGQSVIGSRNSMSSNSYRGRFGEGWGADSANARHAQQQSDWDKTLEKYKNDPKMTKRLQHLRSWKADAAEKAAHAGQYVVRGRGHKFPGEDLEEARSDQVYTINTIRERMMGPSSTRSTSGTLAELLDYFGHTLETGKSYEHERGRYKINMNPKNIQSLVDNLNKAKSNAAANGHSSIYYEVAEQEQEVNEGWESAEKANKAGDDEKCKMYQTKAGRLGESKPVPVISAFRKGMEKIAASNMTPQAKQAAFDRLSTEFHKNASAYSDAVKARRLKTSEDIQPMANPQATGSVNPANQPTDQQAEQDPKTAAQTAIALNTLKSAAGITAQPTDIAKALDDVSQGKQVNQQDMTKLKPMMDVMKTAGTDPKVAQQFKNLSTQAKQTQLQQQQQAKQQPKT